MDVEKQKLNEGNATSGAPSNENNSPEKAGAITILGIKVLLLLTFQNCFKNILYRVVMKDHGGFLLSTAVIVIELMKLGISTAYIVLIQKRSPLSIITFIRTDWRNTMLLMVPATAYNFQMSLEYLAMANIDPSSFSVLVQLKMLTTAFFFRTVLKRRLLKKQVLSLASLTVGVMLCNVKSEKESTSEEIEEIGSRTTGIIATLAIAASSGFASVYTEKVIKSAKKINDPNRSNAYGLAYMQAQLAIVSLVILGAYVLVQDYDLIVENGFFHNYDAAAAFSSLNSAVGGLIVAAVLKYANSVLKAYATASSVLLTGLASHILFGTELSVFYGLGMINIFIALILYNSKGLDEFTC